MKHFRGPDADTGDPVSKIVSAVTKKKTQLPSSEFGFLAIDNFDLGVESDPEGGPTHDYIIEAFCELERLAADNPGGWEAPSGVVIMTSSAEGDAARRMEFPHLIWINHHSSPMVSLDLVAWIASALPQGEIVDMEAKCP